MNSFAAHQACHCTGQADLLLHIKHVIAQDRWVCLDPCSAQGWPDGPLWISLQSEMTHHLRNCDALASVYNRRRERDCVCLCSLENRAGHSSGSLLHNTAKIDPLTDHIWNKENPRWLRATVWTAQAVAWNWLQESVPVPGPTRCAACATEIPDNKPNTRCSKCLLVSQALRLFQSYKWLPELQHISALAGVLLRQNMSTQGTSYTQALLSSAQLEAVCWLAQGQQLCASS